MIAPRRLWMLLVGVATAGAGGTKGGEGGARETGKVEVGWYLLNGKEGD